MIRPLATLCLLGVLSLAGGSAWGAAKNYAYLLVQGRIYESGATDPIAGVTVRLVSAEAGPFEAVTGRNGVFVFDRLPVASYEVQVIDAAGRVIRSAREIDPGDPDRSRVELRMDGRGEAGALRMDTREGRTVLVAPKPPPDKKRLWKQMAIFVGIAGLFAL